MNKIEYTTTSGNKVEFGIRTETPNLADNNVTNKCWQLFATVNGTEQYGPTVTTDPKHGLAIKVLGGIIPVPAGHAAEVTAIYDAYRAELDRRLNASLEADHKYEQSRDAVLRRLNQ